VRQQHALQEADALLALEDGADEQGHGQAAAKQPGDHDPVGMATPPEAAEQAQHRTADNALRCRRQ
jgi:hypothetical protein